MTFIVTWAVSALQELARVESAAAVPESVHQARDWVDYTLRRIPLDVGESRDENYRLWYGDVLGIWYQVNTDAGTVRILAVGPARRRRRDGQ